MKYFFFLTLGLLFFCTSKNNMGNTSIIDYVFQDNLITIDSLEIKKINDPKITSFYKNFHNQTVWNTTKLRESFFSDLKNCDTEGMNPEDYNYSQLVQLESKYNDMDTIQKGSFDLFFTKNLQKYVSDISKGKVNPKSIYKDWDLKEKNIEVNNLLFQAIVDNNLDDILQKCKPKHAVYQSLKESLNLLKEYPEDTIPLIDYNPKTKLVLHKSNKIVPIIKQKLMYWQDMKYTDTITNIFDNQTKEALKKFQSRHGLNPDGVVGKGTILALNYTRNQRIEQVISNLERWRWFSSDFGKNYLLINIPDYTLVAINNGDTIQKQRIVVGKESRQTPVLESRVSNINLNPNWTVPPTILKEDIYPLAIKDKSTFSKKGLVIYNSKSQEISPWQWTIKDAYKYKYVQNPSRNNALGSMKINFPNSHSVYLHDTNHRDFFVYYFRSLSSGCVRLENPLEMAAYLINNPEEWPLKTIQDTTDINHYKKIQAEKIKKIAIKDAKLLAKNPNLILPERKYKTPELKTIVIKIKDTIGVQQLYWTAWSKNKQLYFREDIYCLDSPLYSKLRY